MAHNASHKEGYTLWVIHGAPPYRRLADGWFMVHPHRERYSMGGSWCTPIEKITLRVVHGAPP